MRTKCSQCRGVTVALTSNSLSFESVNLRLSECIAFLMKNRRIVYPTMRELYMKRNSSNARSPVETGT